MILVCAAVAAGSGCCCRRQNYQAYQDALAGLNSIVGYAVKANNNLKIIQVGGCGVDGWGHGVGSARVCCAS